MLAIALFACALPALAAQTGASPAAQIRDHLRKAAEYLKEKNPDSAVKELDAVLALDPKNSEAYANLGVIAFFHHDYRNAANYLRNALAINPSLVKTQALLGVCERRLGEPSAKGLLEKSFPKLKDKSLQIQVGLELANIYYGEGDLDRTAAVLRSLVDIDPDNIEILYMAQLVYSELAEDTLNKLAILAPGSARMQQVVAERLINGGDLKGAIEHYRKALEIDPHLPGLHYELGEAILESSPAAPETQAEAKKEFQADVDLEGDSAKVQCELGYIAFLQSDMEGAHTHYAQALSLDPQNARAQLGLGKLLLLEGKPEDAKKYLEMAVHADPLDGPAHFQLAEAYRRLEMMDKARKETELFQEIKRAKDRVEELYRQMHRPMKPQAGEVPDGASSTQ